MADSSTAEAKTEVVSTSSAAASAEQPERTVNLGFVDTPPDPAEAFHPDNQPSKVGGKPVRIAL